MNHYDGEPIDLSVVKPWLYGFAADFSGWYCNERTVTTYSSGNVMMAMGERASKFRKSGLPYKQSTSDAIIVDFINWIAGHRCGMDLAMYTSDL